MALPINIDNLLGGRTIESNRLEFKEKWNPLKVLHTVCAFANDLENCGGGYIVIGIRDDGGFPGEIVGLTDKEITEIDEQLLNICSLIEPKYIPELSVETYKDRRVAVIWAVSDDRRPFTCPVSLGKSKNRIERGCYIRHFSHTVRAGRDEEKRLRESSRAVSFDGSVNWRASVDDIRQYLVEDYLRKVSSSLYGRRMDRNLLYDSMRLLGGPPEDRHPLNIALMMFSDRPSDFFPYTRIEVAIIKDVAGRVIDEAVFDGPVDLQITRTLSFLRETVIRERVVKITGKAEADRFFNYPYRALEEILVNAMYHRDYGIPEPVRVHVYSDRIEVTSLPGPDPSISDEDMAELNLRGSSYPNKRLGDCLRELHLTGGRNSGMGEIVGSLRRNGSDMPVYQTDPGRTFLRVIIPIHPDFRDADADRWNPTKGGRRTGREIKDMILSILESHGCLRSGDIALRMGYAGMNPVVRRCLNELIAEGRAEYLYPDKPNDSRQRICLPKVR